MKRRYWTAAEERNLRRLYPDTITDKLVLVFWRPVRQIYAKANQLWLRKSAAYLSSQDSGRLLRGVRRSPATEFQPGQVPHNKGLRRPGWAPGRMRETQFKPGQVSKRWDPEVYCVGALRINSDGGLDIKVADGPRGWCCMARWVWEQAHGPIPRGRAVRYRNGDSHDTRIENLYLATRRDLMRANSIHNLPQPLADVIRLRGAVIRKINRRTRHEPHPGNGHDSATPKLQDLPRRTHRLQG
ncbi:MAG TPA: HNH endonuclease signature motif containing protein [Burkholderiales bacterium]